MSGLSDGVSRTETAEDVATAAPLAGLAATLDHTAPPWQPGEVPPLGRWLYFLPREPQREIAVDGHPHKGGFLPPVALPRRMWAGSRMTFHAPTPVGAPIHRVSTIAAVQEKQGRTGALCFVTVRHENSAEDTPCVTDVHDIVYREAASPGADAAVAPVASGPAPDWQRTVHPGPALLFPIFASLWD